MSENVYVLVDGADIKFDIQVEDKNAAVRALEAEAQKYSGSANTLKQFSQLNAHQPLQGGLAFYAFKDWPKPNKDELFESVEDGGYVIRTDRVAKVWNVTAYTLEEARKNVLRKVDRLYDQKIAMMEVDVEGENVSLSHFMLQYAEYKAEDSADAFDFSYQDGSTVLLTSIRMAQLRDTVDGDIKLILNAKKTHTYKLENASDLELLKENWEKTKTELGV